MLQKQVSRSHGLGLQRTEVEVTDELWLSEAIHHWTDRVLKALYK